MCITGQEARIAFVLLELYMDPGSALRVAAEHGKLHQVRRLLADGAPLSADMVSRIGCQILCNCSLIIPGLMALVLYQYKFL